MGALVFVMAGPVQRLTIAACLAALLATAPAVPAATLSCREVGVGLQVLGSGGPEITDRRASSGYLVWRDGRARVLVDMGPGSMLRFEQSGARVEDLEVILLTHLHVDHSADLPALVKGAFFTERSVDLPVYGPTGNERMPATRAFVASLFNDRDGAYRYLGSYLTGDESFRLVAHDIPAQGKTPSTPVDDARFRLTAVPVHHGPIPALAWRIDIAGRAIVISGDMNGDNHTLETLAAGADLLVAHHAVPEGAQGVERRLHMPPSVIGRIAATAKVKQLVLSHRMNRTLGREKESTRHVRKHYSGSLVFADDGQCFPLAEPARRR
jgi:ribonuclease BN (tRNA processing enzyme)